MKTFVLRAFTLSTVCALLSACNGFFESDNTPTPTPLTSIKTELNTRQAWYTSVNYGVGTDYLKMVPAVNDHAIFTASKDGTVTATDRKSGSTLWRQRLPALSAGAAVNDGIVFVGSHGGRVYALSEADGKFLWDVQVASEVLAPPTAAHGIALVKTIDGQLTALSATDGHVLWRYQQTEPALILRSGSAPQIAHDDVVVGFANGSVSKLTMNEGSLQWQETVAIPSGSFAIQRMVDIDADPVVYNNRVYVATYQGKISALDLSTGRAIWSHDLSSFTGISVDGQRVYASDATSHLWAFDVDTGTVLWRNTQLEARNITGPATLGNYVIVADNQGYLHWLNKQDGHFVARNHVNGFGILATPVVNQDHVYVLTADGHLADYTIG